MTRKNYLTNFDKIFFNFDKNSPGPQILNTAQECRDSDFDLIDRQLRVNQVKPSSNKGFYKNNFDAVLNHLDVKTCVHNSHILLCF